jgi:hypothetical protein
VAVGTTTRFGLTTWSSGDDPMGRAQFQNDNTAVENLAAVYRSGTTASRPAADAASAARSFYYSSTDSVLYFTDGTNWKPLNSLGTSGDAYTVVAGTVSTPQGVSTALARADHKHAVSTAAASTISGSNSEGSSAALARADHGHALATGVVTNTILAADSVDKTKINASSILKTSNSLLTFDTTNGFSVNISSTFFEAVGNAISLKAGSVTTTQLAGNIGKALLATDIVNAAGAITFSTVNGLAVALNSSFLEIVSNAISIKSGSITPTQLSGSIGKAKLATDIVQDALSGNTGGLSFSTTAGLSVNTSTTIGLSANTLIVNSASITGTHLATSVAGAGLSGGGGSALSVNVQGPGITLGAGGDTVTLGTVTSADVNSTVYVRGTMTGLTASSGRIHISNGTNPTGAAGDVLFKF